MSYDDNGRFPARAKFRKLSPEEQKELIARFMSDEGFVARMREAQRELRSGIPGVPLSELKRKYGEP